MCKYVYVYMSVRTSVEIALNSVAFKLGVSIDFMGNFY